MRISPILLAGGLRESKIEQQIGRPPQLFPVRNDLRLIDAWVERFEMSGGVSLPMRAVVSSLGGCRIMQEEVSSSVCNTVVDPRPHRGTAGVLADIARKDLERGEDVDYFLAVDRSSCPPETIRPFLDQLGDTPDVLIAVSEIDRVAGMMAIRCEALGLVPDVGYFDLKEQFVQKVIAQGLVVRATPVMHRALRIDSLASWLETIRFLRDPDYREQRWPDAIVEGVCSIDSSAELGSAKVVDSVIMSGARLGDGVVVARSIVAEGAVIRDGVQVIDSVVGCSEIRGGIKTKRSGAFR